ncbi:GLPGLI family protein [Winogradskyella sp. A3E31]|uniref:GLPGLI family protein n=1 Tax=Winogradskyella sp. A3E31 TaxID=3349637 RepID=UPI00398B8D31
MNTIIRVMVLSLALVFTSVNAQDFQGIATYKTKRSVDIKLDSTRFNSDQQKKMIEMMKKQFEKTFVLTFNKSESTYKEEEKLDKPQVGMGGDFQVMAIGGGGGGDIYYKNTKDNRYVNQTDTFGKVFLVKDSLEQRQWKLEPETKYIGEYLCHKATFFEEVEVTEMRMSDDATDEEMKPKKTKRPKTTTVWYTLQIPINNGPSDYQGLPGLIMEVDDGDQTILCSRIVLNPEDKVNIEEPTKGKEVDQEEYREIMDKKAKEMMERYRPRPGSRDGETIEIRIGG